MPNIFSDPELRARQDVLNAQWNGLWGTYNATCSNGLGNAFPEFATDYNAWRDFYDSESDWSSASKHATDEFQTKAQEWAKRLKDYGCGDSQYSDLGIPGVKDNPTDRPSVLDELEKKARDAAGAGFGAFTLTLVIIGVILIGLVYFLSKSKVGVNV